jgi:hypothetical protein
LVRRFHFDRFIDCLALTVVPRALTGDSNATHNLATCTTRFSSLLCALVALMLAACAGVPQAPPPPDVLPPPTAPSQKPQAPPTASTNPSSNVNLQGFPLPYRQGYADGCASVGTLEQKDAGRFKTDGQYRTGWTDGFALCKKH